MDEDLEQECAHFWRYRRRVDGELRRVCEICGRSEIMELGEEASMAQSRLDQRISSAGEIIRQGLNKIFTGDGLRSERYDIRQTLQSLGKGELYLHLRTAALNGDSRVAKFGVAQIVGMETGDKDLRTKKQRVVLKLEVELTEEEALGDVQWPTIMRVGSNQTVRVDVEGNEVDYSKRLIRRTSEEIETENE